jgi:uncharacterized membrane protein YecN with MAPEG domain
MVNLVPVTALYAALNALLNIALAARVALLRTTQKVSLGPGESAELMQAIRIHGNNAEYVPLALLMSLVCELGGGKSVPLHVFGGVLFVSRVCHVIGIPRRPPNVFRSIGIGGTWGVVIAASAYALFLRM